jgi:hypothetical protein
MSGAQVLVGSGLLQLLGNGGREGVRAMATVQPWIPSTSETMSHERTWSDDEKREWLAAHGGAATHVVTFEPPYQIEMCIPPWEQPDRHIARSAVAWGQDMRQVFDAQDHSAAVVAAHHEGNSLEVHHTVQARPRLRSIS